MVQSRQSLPSLSAELAPHTMSLPPSLPRSSLSLASRPPCWATASRTCTCKWRHAWTRGTTGSSTQRQVEQWAETALTHRQLRSRGIPIPIHAHTHAHACAHPCTYARTRMRPSMHIRTHTHAPIPVCRSWTAASAAPMPRRPCTDARSPATTEVHSRNTLPRARTRSSHATHCQPHIAWLRIYALCVVQW